MDLLNELKALGADIDDAMGRFLNNEALYVRMLKKLVNNVRENEVLSYINDGDFEQAVAYAHTLKGVMGNLSLTPLFTAYTEIVSLLRAGENDKAKKTLEDILPLQEKFISCIESCG